ncbi:hypothetical protein QFC21_000033 [Naganishia friedmannii]|uniref:Uncharacterized protein n=1 Tax=Naganishia friedmannii TaxID=89922 RepID=A0ACC2WAD5_9TREE|nr:hypothetical protein QFC21_000033 [Naganishia friedmannii]
MSARPNITEQAYWFGPRPVVAVEVDSPPEDHPVLHMTGLAIVEKGDSPAYEADVVEKRTSTSSGDTYTNDGMTDAQCKLIDNLVNAIYELRQQGKKLTTPDDVLAEMLRQKSFFTRARLTFTELIVLAVKKGFVQYLKNNNGLYICKFKYDSADFKGL